MKFLDQAKVCIQSGGGGRGCMSFRHERNIEFGGPNGGDGGKGGHVYAKAYENLNTLIDYRYQQHFCAAAGENGGGSQCTGAAGKPCILKTPVGTQIFMEDKKTLIADMITVGQCVMLARGGDGGKGNTHFKSSTNRAPRRADPGWPGVQMWIWLHLKLIAEIGLVGLPNAGKSTLLRSLTRAHPKVASYPFTTLHPHLGVISKGNVSFVMADLPGLIEGAHVGKGLGHRFLSHVERCKYLFHVVDGCSHTLDKDYKIIDAELNAYGQNILHKPRCVLLNKVDAMSQEHLEQQLILLKSMSLYPIYPISSVTHQGLERLTNDCVKFFAQT